MDRLCSIGIRYATFSCSLFNNSVELTLWSASSYEYHFLDVPVTDIWWLILWVTLLSLYILMHMHNMSVSGDLSEASSKLNNIPL